MNKIPSGKKGRMSQDTVYPRCVLISKSALSTEILETIDAGLHVLVCLEEHMYTLAFIPSSHEG